MYCDNVGLIQNSDNIPLLFHWRRNRADKRIAFSHLDFWAIRSSFKFSTDIPKRDFLDFRRLNFDRYWWLSDNSKHIPDIADRRLRLIRTNSH